MTTPIYDRLSSEFYQATELNGREEVESEDEKKGSPEGGEVEPLEGADKPWDWFNNHQSSIIDHKEDDLPEVRSADPIPNPNPEEKDDSMGCQDGER